LIAPCKSLGHSDIYLDFLTVLKELDIERELYRPRKIIYLSYFQNTGYYSFLIGVLKKPSPPYCESTAGDEAISPIQ